MGVRSKKETKNISKQLLLVLLFILACVLLSHELNVINTRKDSDLRFYHNVYTIPDGHEPVYFGDGFIYVPNIDYEDIDNGEFSFYDYVNYPYATNVSISTESGWYNLGNRVEWHNSNSMPEERIIEREGKQKHSGVYLLTLRFDNPDIPYYLNIPDSNGLVGVYCNENKLGYMWGRTNEWSPTIGFGYGYVPIIPDIHGTARIMIAVSTNIKITNPGILSYPSITPSTDSMSASVVPALWLLLQLILFLFILIGGFLISRTFKNRTFFYLFLAVETMAIVYTFIDSNFLVLDAYSKELLKFVIFILLNTLMYIFIDTFFASTDPNKKHMLVRIAPMSVIVTCVFLVLWTISERPAFGIFFPLVPEVAFICFVAILTAYNVIFVHYGEDITFYVTIAIICQIFFSANALSNINREINIPTYSVFFVIANLTLEFYFISRYVIQARTLEDTMGRMQFLVQEKTLRISEINKDLYNTNKRLLENEHARKNVLSNVSHDLRTPITAIRGYAEILLSPSANMNDTQKENYLRNIIRRAEQMEHIISDIVELTRLESTPNEFQFIDVSITELLDEICMMYEADLESTKKELIVELPEDDLLFVKADPKKLSRVFENLISNAVNYTYDEAKITVKAWREEANQKTPYETVRIDIIDNGIGIPDNEIPMIFDRFYRAKNSGKNIKGTGIGLSIVKTIIDRHNATISVESAIGKGTSFHIVMKAAVY
ncbi:MAG: HAMP domain-containing histidine kinase [Clostridiales bacterium]|nr:HAMP domain-containing histidine kinase [Clostridiales bacterium]